MASTVKVGITATDEGFKQTLDNMSRSAQAFGNSMQQSGGKAKTLNGQLREARKSAQELTMQWRQLDDATKNSDFGRALQSQLQDVLNTAGRLQDIKGDVANEIKNLASDTQMWDAAKEGIDVLSSSMQSFAGIVGMCGGDVQAFTKAINTMKTIEAAANAVIKIGNMLQNISAVRTALRTVKNNLFTASEVAKTAAEQADTRATTVNTAAELTNAAATSASTVKQNLWNVAKAIAKALLGDYSGLLLVGIGVLASYTMATAASTEAVEDQSQAIKDNSDATDVNTILKERLKKEEKEWSDSVTSGAQSQIEAYVKLQLKWQECNRDQKTREKFQKDYGEQVNIVAGKVLKLTEYEDFFVKNTDKVVEAILARAAAEASAKKYADALNKQRENDRNGTRANGRYWTVYHEGDLLTEAEAENLHKTAGLEYYHNLDLVMTGRTDYPYKLSKRGSERATNYAAQVAKSLRDADQADIDFWHNAALEDAERVKTTQEAAGMGPGYNPPKAFNGSGGHPGKHGSSGSSGSGSGSDQPKPAEGSLAWMKEKLAETQKALEYGLIPEKDIEATKKRIAQMKEDIEQKEIDLGIREEKIEPVIGSLEWLNNQVSTLQHDLQNGLIPDEDIEQTKKDIQDLKDQASEEAIRIGVELEPRTDFERNERAHKYENDWKDLERYASDYGAKWSEYQEKLKQYEQDVKAYNEAWARYNESLKGYNKHLKDYQKYNDLLNERNKLEQDHDNDLISDDDYAKKLAKIDDQIKKYSEVIWGVEEASEAAGLSQDEFARESDKLTEQLRKGIITQNEYDQKYQDLCNSLATLDNVAVHAFSKPIEPKIKLPEKPFDPLTHALIEDIFSALDDIPAHTQKLINDVNDFLSNNDIPLGVRIEIGNYVLPQLQKKLDEQTKGKLHIEAEVEPTFFEYGSNWELAKSYENQASKIQRIADWYDKGIIKSSDEARDAIAKLNGELIALGMNPVTIEIKTEGMKGIETMQDYLGNFNTAIVSTIDSFDSLIQAIDEGKSGWEIFKASISTVEQLLTGIATIMQVVQTLEDAHNATKAVTNALDSEGATTKTEEAVAQASIAATSPSVVAALTSQASVAGTAAAPLKLAAAATEELAAAQMFAAHASIPFVGAAFGAASVATMRATLAALKATEAFAQGGIVSGSTTIGDNVLVRANAGEMILNRSQQSNLFRLLNEGVTSNGDSYTTSTVKVRGKDLYLSLRNYNKSQIKKMNFDR